MTLAGFRWRPALLAATIAFFAGLALPAADALARAGGGTSHSSSSHSSSSSRSSSGFRSSSHSSYGGHGGGGSPLLPLVLFVGGFFALVAMSGRGKKTAAAPPRRQYDKADSQALLLRIARADDAWSPEHMQRRVKEIYHHVQDAWTERNQEIAKDFMSPRLYAKHKRQTDDMIARGLRNVLEDVRLLDCEIVHVADRKGTHDDEFWAIITGSMIDYEVRDNATSVPFLDDPTTARLVGVMQQMRTPPQRFQELWKFVRDDRGWVLDKIEQDLNAGLDQARLFSQEANSM